MYPSFSVTKTLLSETAIARGLSRFSAKIITESFSEYEFGFGNGIDVSLSEEVKTNTENIVSKATKLIQYGWKKEAVPVINAKKSLIARFFEVIFG